MTDLSISAQFTPTVTADERLKSAVAALLREPLQNPRWTVPKGEALMLADKSSSLADKSKWARPRLEVRVESKSASTSEVLASFAGRLATALSAVRRAEEGLSIGIQIDGRNGKLWLAWRVQDAAGEIQKSLESQVLTDLDVDAWGWSPDESRWLKL
jgi:hypothetical protein